MGKQILADVCAPLSYLPLRRNPTSRTTDNVVMEITFICLLPSPPWYQAAEGWIQTGVARRRRGATFQR